MTSKRPLQLWNTPQLYFVVKDRKYFPRQGRLCRVGSHVHACFIPFGVWETVSAKNRPKHKVLVILK